MSDTPLIFSKEATAKFPQTIAHILADEDYVHCPDCGGDGQVYAYRELENSRSGQDFDCPLCRASKEADRDAAITFLRDWELEQGIDE